MRKIILSVTIFFCFFFFNKVIAQTVFTAQPGTQRAVENFHGINTASFVKPNEGLGESTLVNAITSLNPSTLRFPPGRLGNYWNWVTGNYFDDAHLQQYNLYLPNEYNAFAGTMPDNSFERFADMVKATAGTPVFELNIMTSDADYQLAMLLEAKRLNIPIKYIELGNEFCNDNEDYAIAFPTAESYAEKAFEFIMKIRAFFGNDVKIAVVGSGSYPNNSRKYEWSKKVISTLKTLVNGSQNPNNYTGANAIVLHHYERAKGSNGISNECVSVTAEPCTSSTISDMDAVMNYNYMQIFNNTNSSTYLKRDMNDIAAIADAQDYEIWITEYNLDDREGGAYYKVKINGTWAQAMVVGLQGLAMAEVASDVTPVKNIALTNYWTAWGNGAYNAVYSSTDALEAMTDYCPPQNASVTTGEKSAMGYALELIFNASRDATEITPIVFEDASSNLIPDLFNQSDVKLLYGISFTGGGRDEAVIINLSHCSLIIDLTNVGSFDHHIAYSAAPTDYIAGNLTPYDNQSISLNNIFHQPFYKLQHEQ